MQALVSADAERLIGQADDPRVVRQIGRLAGRFALVRPTQNQNRYAGLFRQLAGELSEIGNGPVLGRPIRAARVQANDAFAGR